MFKNYNFFNRALLIILSIGIISCFGLFACSGGEKDKEQSQTENTKTTGQNEESQPRVIEIEGLDSLKFSVTDITANPGEKITVKLSNNSSMPAKVMSHNFVLVTSDTNPGDFVNKVLSDNQEGKVPDSLNDNDLADTGLVAGGESKSVTFTVPETPGKYTYLCTFPGHFAAGMKGTLTVQ